MCVCVFITAVPIIKLFAWGEGCVWLLGQTFQVMSLKRRIAAEVFSPSRRTNSDGEQILSWITRAVQIVAAPSSHSHSSLSPSEAKKLGAIAGLVRSFDLQAIDRLMNFAVYDDLAGPDRFLVSLIPENIDPEGDDRMTVDAMVTNNGDGTYLATYFITVAGSYTLDIRLQPVNREVSKFLYVPGIH